MNRRNFLETLGLGGAGLLLTGEVKNTSSVEAAPLTQETCADIYKLYGEVVVALNQAISTQDWDAVRTINLMLSTMELNRKIQLDQISTISLEETIDTMLQSQVNAISFTTGFYGQAGANTWLTGNERWRLHYEPSTESSLGNYYLEVLAPGFNPGEYAVTERTLLLPEGAVATAQIRNTQLTGFNTIVLNLSLNVGGTPGLYSVDGLSLTNQ